MPSEGQSHAHGQPKHEMPLMPSVLRLLKDSGISDASKITATGFRGRLTKGDILAYLGKIENPLGSAKKLEDMKKKGQDSPKAAGYGGTSIRQDSQNTLQDNKQQQQETIMTGTEFRRWIASGLAKTEKQQQQATATMIQTPVPLVTFDDVLDGYLARSSSTPKTATPLPAAPKASSGWDEAIGI